MIKNEIQFKRAKNRIEKINNEIEEFRNDYSEEEFEFFTDSLITEMKKLQTESLEYNLLINNDLNEVISSKLIQPELIENIGDMLTKIRLAANIPQSSMAESLGWHQPNLSRFESENYSGQTVNKIVEYTTNLGIQLKVFPVFIDRDEEVEISIVPRRFAETDSSSTSSSISFRNLNQRTDYSFIPDLLELDSQNRI